MWARGQLRALGLVARRATLWPTSSNTELPTAGSAGRRSAGMARPGRLKWRGTRRGGFSGEVAKGGDPASTKREARQASTVAELCDAYLESCKAGRVLTRRQTTKKASTLDGDRGRIERHVKPLLGTLKVAAVTPRDIERFRDGVSEGATAPRNQDRQAWARARHRRSRHGDPRNGYARRGVCFRGTQRA